MVQNLAVVHGNVHNFNFNIKINIKKNSVNIRAEIKRIKKIKLVSNKGYLT
jgi:hypothetical protein